MVYKGVVMAETGYIVQSIEVVACGENDGADDDDRKRCTFRGERSIAVEVV